MELTSERVRQLRDRGIKKLRSGMSLDAMKVYLN